LKTRPEAEGGAERRAEGGQGRRYDDPASPERGAERARGRPGRQGAAGKGAGARGEEGERGHEGGWGLKMGGCQLCVATHNWVLAGRWAEEGTGFFSCDAGRDRILSGLGAVAGANTGDRPSRSTGVGRVTASSACAEARNRPSGSKSYFGEVASRRVWA